MQSKKRKLQTKNSITQENKRLTRQTLRERERRSRSRSFKKPELLASQTRPIPQKKDTFAIVLPKVQEELMLTLKEQLLSENYNLIKNQINLGQVKQQREEEFVIGQLEQEEFQKQILQKQQQIQVKVTQEKLDQMLKGKVKQAKYKIEEEEIPLTNVSTNITYFPDQDSNKQSTSKSMFPEHQEDQILQFISEKQTQLKSQCKLPLKIEPSTRLIIEEEEDIVQHEESSKSEQFVREQPRRITRKQKLEATQLKQEHVFQEEEETTETAKAKPKTVQQVKILNQYLGILQQLDESSLPAQITCRDDEKQLIENFLVEGLEGGGQSQALYISGQPGIGKTASFLEVKNRLSEVYKFHFVHFNGMNLANPENIYCQLLFELTGVEKTSRKQACLLLNEIFTNGKLPTQYKKLETEITAGNKVILLDECDFLLTADQVLLYNLLDWPSHKKSKLTIIMIANTMDFPERLKPKLQSRLGKHRLVYQPYTSKQIEQIIAQRLSNMKTRSVFSDDSLTFICKKVAVISSDIRKTLSICKEAVNLAREDYLTSKKKTLIKEVTIEMVKIAYSKIYSQPYHICLSSLSEKMKLLIISIALEAHFLGYNLAYLSRIWSRFNQLLATFCGSRLTYSQNEIMIMVNQLKEMSLLQTKEKDWLQTKLKTENKPKQECDQLTLHQDINNIYDQSIQLTLTLDDLKNSFRDDHFFAKFQNLFRN